MTPADLVVRAEMVHTMDSRHPSAMGVAVRHGRIIALARRQDELDGLIGQHTTVLTEPGVVVLPAFIDTHNHLMGAARNTLGVGVSQARTIDEFVDLIRRQATKVSAGQWIVTAMDWHELRLAERRMPTATELDRASMQHPILALRGGHNGVLNSAGLRLTGIDAGTPDILGGFIARDATGRPTGWVHDAALERVQRVVPPPAADAVAAGLTQASAHYAARGIGTVRDPAVTPQGWRTYQQTYAAGRLFVRSHVMIMSTPAAIEVAGSMDAYLDQLKSQGIRPGDGDAGLRLWGLKFVLDGGVEAAALRESYAERPDYYGELLWDRAALIDALTVATRRGWPVGTHAFGDRAIALLLDAVRAVRDRIGSVPRGALVVEHGGLIGAHIAEAVDLGVHITVQQPLLDGLAEALVAEWGPDRVADLFPLRELINAGAWISAGSDHPVGPVDPLRAMHGMLTRKTPAGILGAGHIIDRTEALQLYTTAGAPLLGGLTGTLVPGAVADLVGYPADPLTCPPEQLLLLSPVFTVVNGRLVHRSR
ncbi:MAG: amidohydrolase [Pseudonocardiaceae bacterium]